MLKVLNTIDIAGAVDDAVKEYLVPQMTDLGDLIFWFLAGLLTIIALIVAGVFGFRYYKSRQEMNWTAPAILLGGAILLATAPLWIWTAINWR